MSSVKMKTHQSTIIVIGKIDSRKNIKTVDGKFMTGSIINNLGKQLFLPKSLSTRYCREFLDANEECKQKSIVTSLPSIIQLIPQ